MDLWAGIFLRDERRSKRNQRPGGLSAPQPPAPRASSHGPSPVLRSDALVTFSTCRVLPILSPSPPPSPPDPSNGSPWKCSPCRASRGHTAGNYDVSALSLWPARPLPASKRLMKTVCSTSTSLSHFLLYEEQFMFFLCRKKKSCLKYVRSKLAGNKNRQKSHSSLSFLRVLVPAKY